MYLLISTLVISLSLLMFLFMFNKKQIVENFYNFISSESMELPKMSRAFLTPMEDALITGSGTAVRSCTQDKCELQIEATLPMGIGGDYNTEDVKYYAKTGSLEIDLERSRDGFFRGSSDKASKLEKMIKICWKTPSDSGDIMEGTFSCI